MDLAITNGEEKSSVLATIGNEINGVAAAATDTEWTEPEPEPKEKVLLGPTPLPPPPVVSQSPDNVVDLPVSADLSPNDAPIHQLPNLPMDEVISVAVGVSALTKLTTVCDNLFPPPLEQKEQKVSENAEQQMEQQGEEGEEQDQEQQQHLQDEASSSSSSSSVAEERKPVEEVNHFTGELSPSILRANEEMMSEDEEEQMEIHHSPTEPIINSSKDSVIMRDSSSSGSHHSPSPYAGSDSELTTSGIVSSFNTDSFLFGPSSRECSESVSPDKPISMVPKHLTVVPSGVASFTSDPINIPNNATAAQMDMSIHNFPKRHRHVHRAAVYAMHPYHRATCRGGTGVNVAKTLDLLKAVMQSSFNQEIKKLCDDYFQIYGMAAMNIHESTGDNVPQSTLRLLVCKMLEEALQGYQNDKWEFSSVQLPKNDRVSEYKGSPMSTKKSRSDKDSKYGTVGKRGRKPTEKAADNRSAWRWSLDKRRLDPVKWSIDKLNADTKFVLGVNVNKALGHAANRGKVYILHPQLFKYVCDGDDKTWLFDNKYMPVHGGKAFLMIFDEVEILTKSDDNYRESTEILKSVQNLKRFTVPLFMLNKMREFVKNVQGYFAQENASAQSTNALPSTSEGTK